MTRNATSRQHGSALRRCAAAEDGQALAITLVMLFMMLALLSLVISAGLLRQAHHQVQIAADAGALAAADEIYAGANTVTTTGESLATSNAPNSTVTVQTPVGGDGTKAEVTVSETVPTLFSQFLGTGQAQVSASAVAQSDINSAVVGDADITPDGCTGICTYYTPNVYADGPWVVTFGNVDLQNCDGGTGIGCTLPAGYASPEVVDLNGYLPGGIAQTISTIAGGQYTLTFDLTGNPYQCTDPNYTFTGDVVIGSTTTAFSHQNASCTDVTYDQISVPFVATSPSTTIEFYSTSNRSGLADYAGPEIADISIQYPSTALIQ